ncbi:MAG: BatD family protein [Bacteroidota bacterium]
MKWFLLYSAFCCAMLVRAQKEFVELDVSPAAPEVGQQVTLTIKTNAEGNYEFDLPDEFERSGASQSGMSSSVNYSNGQATVVRFSYQKIIGHFEREGTYQLGPVKVRTNGGTVTSNTVDVEVRKRQNMISERPEENMDQAIFGIIQQSGKEIYEGQSVVLEGKVYAQVDILQVERYQPFDLDGAAETHDLQNSKQVRRSYEQVSGKDVMTFKIGKKIVFPENIGTFDVTPFSAVLAYDSPRSLFPERAKIRSNSASVKVKPLPDGVPDAFIGGVGNFSLDASLNKEKLHQGDVVELQVNISGKGNLHNIEAPDIQLPKGSILYGDPEETDSIQFTSAGAQGKMTFTFFVQMNEAGKVNIPPIEIAYFDPDKEKYVEETQTFPEIEVEPSQNAVALPDDEKEVTEEASNNYVQTLRVEKTAPSGYPVWMKHWRTSLILCSPILLAFVLGGFIKNRERQQLKIARDQEKAVQLQATLNQIDRLEDERDEGTASGKAVELLRDYMAALWETDKVNINREFISDSAKNEVISEKLADQVIAFFDRMEEWRYSGGIFKEQKSDVLEEAREIAKALGEK